MTFDLHTFILGVVQGLCEFLPVSSSGHLALLQNFFGFNQEGLLAFDLLLHCATVLVILLFFRRETGLLAVQWTGGWFSSRARQSWGWRYGWSILLASALTAAVGLPLKNTVERLMGSSLAVGCGLLVTAVLLAIVPLWTSGENTSDGVPASLRYEAGRPLTLRAVLAVGIVQGLAVLPGVSRSGSTIAAGLIMGLAVDEAFRFSFLVSVPAVLGASLLEGLKLYREGLILTGDGVLPAGWLWAAAAAFVLGWIALKLMHRLVLSGRWAYFGLYCLFLGSAAILAALAIF
ncbi:MAG: undecaprenyl-diphosphate phosphatase [Fretibacterium sp.]|nr:undecaprenyl-diphosphate phosphatase [Fretibacterium sp.]